MNEAWIVAYGRSACCRARKGGLAGTHPVDYAAQVLRGVLDKVPQLTDDAIDDVIVGCAMPSKQLDRNAARIIAKRAGLPDCVPGYTINRFCASGLQAIADAANAIVAGQMDCVAAGGVEDMTDCFAPDYPVEYQNKFCAEREPGMYMSMGETAERVADRYGITRLEMEKIAVVSHQKAYSAQQSGLLAPSIIPVVNVRGETVSRDDGIRPDTTLEQLEQLKTPFRENGRVTAATSSQTTDGAAFVIVMSSTKAVALGIKPLARFIGCAVSGCDATEMGLGPIFAVPKVMARTGLQISDMDVIELNEAFASQVIACCRALELPLKKVNPYGGAMALGHPMGATGAVLTGKALDYLSSTGGRYALVSMCVGGGQGAAAIFERM